MHLSEKILRHRKQLGLSQEELAARLGVTRQAVSKWELGTSQPELETLVALAKTFGVTTDYLLSDDPEPQALEKPYPDWADHLPRSLRRLFVRYGWLAGLYLAGIGLLWILMGTFVRWQVRQMFGGMDMAGMFPGYHNPVESLAKVIQVVGMVTVLGGIALALWLRKKGKKDS